MKNKDLNKMILAAVMFILMFAVVGCSQGADNAEVAVEESSNTEGLWQGQVEDFDYDEYCIGKSIASDYRPAEGLPIVKIEIKDGSPIVLELYPDNAPNTVNNFLALSRSGFYDGLIFHRIIVDFMIQGGDPLGTGGGNPGYSIDGEFSKNGFDNAISHEPGVISMARSRDYNSAGSQFFIVHGDATFLDGDYAGFGKVIYGFEEVDRLARVETASGDKPKVDVIMESVRVDLNGYEFTQPEINR